MNISTFFPICLCTFSLPCAQATTTSANTTDFSIKFWWVKTTNKWNYRITELQNYRILEFVNPWEKGIHCRENLLVLEEGWFANCVFVSSAGNGRGVFIHGVEWSGVASCSDFSSATRLCLLPLQLTTYYGINVLIFVNTYALCKALLKSICEVMQEFLGWTVKCVLKCKKWRAVYWRT